MADENIYSAETLASAPRKVREGFRLMEHWLDKTVTQTYPRLVAVSTNEEYIFEIAPDLTMSVMRVFDTDASFWRCAIEDAAVATCLASFLRPQADQYRRELEELVERSGAKGAPVRLIRLHVDGIDCWRAPREAAFVAYVEVLGENLRPALMTVGFKSSKELKRSLQRAVREQKTRYPLLQDLQGLGADGMIDDMALHALLNEPAPESLIRKLRHKNGFNLSDGAHLCWKEGVVTSFAIGDHLWREQNIVTLKVALPELVCEGGKGRPVTQVVEHPALSKAMRVRDIRSSPDTVRPKTQIALDLPLHLLNTAAGTHWPKGEIWNGIGIDDAISP